MCLLKFFPANVYRNDFIACRELCFIVLLQLCHNTVVDTSIVFPDKRGLPYKRSLRNLMSDILNKNIQGDGKTTFVYISNDAIHGLNISYSLQCTRRVRLDAD